MSTTLRVGIGFTGENLSIERIVELGVAAEWPAWTAYGTSRTSASPGSL